MYEFLKPILGDELFAQFLEKMEAATGVTLANIADGSHIPKAKFDELNGKYKTANQSITSLTQQLQEANDKLGGLDGLNAQIQQLKDSLAGKDKEISGIKRSHALLALAREAGAKNPEMLVKMLDQGKITEKEDGTLDGVTAQFDAFKKSDGYLFNAAPGARGGAGTPPDEGGKQTVNEQMNMALRQASGRQ